MALGNGWMLVAVPPKDLAGHLNTMKQLCAEAGCNFNDLGISVTFLQQPELQPQQEPKRAVTEYTEAGAHRLILAPVLERATAERTLEQLAKDYLS